MYQEDTRGRKQEELAIVYSHQPTWRLLRMEASVAADVCLGLGAAPATGRRAPVLQDVSMGISRAVWSMGLASKLALAAWIAWGSV